MSEKVLGNEGLEAIESLIASHKAEVANWNWLINNASQDEKDQGWADKWHGFVVETMPKIRRLKNQAMLLGPAGGIDG